MTAPDRSTTARAPLVFITGASSGIGQALALRYQRAGYRLALVGRRTEAMADWLAAQAFPDAAEHAVYRANVADPVSIRAAGQRCIAAQGLPQVVIANAGISLAMDSAVFKDLAVLQRVLATNTVGIAATFHPFVAAMRVRRSGTLVGIASVAGIRGLPGRSAYCASKAAAIAYCESLRGELRGSGVEVVTISPGYIDTPFTRGRPYAMPFLMPVGPFADRAYDAIAAGAWHRVIPWQMAAVARVMRLLPAAVFDRLAAGRSSKPRADMGDV